MLNRPGSTCAMWKRKTDMKQMKRMLVFALILALITAVPVLATELPPLYVGKVTLEQLPENWNPMGCS